MDAVTIVLITTGLLVLVVGLWLNRIEKRAKNAGRVGTPSRKEANDLLKADPTAAQALMDSEFQAQAERELQRKAVLRERARSDLAAARELRTHLLKDLDTDVAALKDFRKDPTATPTLLAQIEESERNGRAELAQLDDWIRQLTSSHGAA